MNLPEGAIRKLINEQSRHIGRNEELKDVLPKTYIDLENDTLVTVYSRFILSLDIEGDAGVKISEYFLVNFA